MNYKFVQTKLFKEEYLDSIYKEKINQLILSINNDGLLKGIGKPEFLKYKKVYSRRINQEDRLLYKLSDNMKTIELISCKGHY